MKLIQAFVILFFLNNCSFDNKSGIWNDETTISQNNQIDPEQFVDLNKLLLNNDSFNKTIKLDKNFIFKLSTPIKNLQWNNNFYNENNSLDNFKYNNSNKQLLKTKKLSKYKNNNSILYYDHNIIFSDVRGNIIFFSIKLNKEIYKFNFYKKKFKKIEKNLNLFVKNNIIYVSDNLGYLYALNFKSKKVVWAKNYKIPFRSNLKVEKGKIFASNLNNDLFVFNQNSGEIVKRIPTEPIIVNNVFKNNIALNKNLLFFLNSYGSLYAVDLENFNVKWFINLNQSSNLNPSNLFLGNQIIYSKKKIIVSSNFQTYIINSETGTILYKKNFSSTINPIVNNEYLFLITKNNFLISMNLKNGKILYSYNIDQKIADFLNIKKKKVKFKRLMLANDSLFMFLNNSYLLNFDIRGGLKEIHKNDSSYNSQPILVNNSLLFLDTKNRLRSFN